MKKKIIPSIGWLIMAMALLPIVSLAAEYPDSTTAQVDAGIRFYQNNDKPGLNDDYLNNNGGNGNDPLGVGGNNHTSGGGNGSSSGLPGRLPTTGGGNQSALALSLSSMGMMCSGLLLVTRKR